MASPSAVSWMSHSMAKFPATAAAAAPGMFSMMPRARSCRPRWATGRAVSQSGARIRMLRLRDLENTLDLDRGIGGQGRDADGRPGMAALVAEGCDHQVGGAVQHLWPVEEIRRRINKTAEPDPPHHLVEVAQRGLDLGQQVDGAAARRGIALLDGDAGPELALGDPLAFGIDADLAGHKQQIAGAHEADIIRHRSCGLVQGDALCRQFLLDRSCHVSPQDSFRVRIPRPKALGWLNFA